MPGLYMPSRPMVWPDPSDPGRSADAPPSDALPRSQRESKIPLEHLAALLARSRTATSVPSAFSRIAEQACLATSATAAAIALKSGDSFVCRASSGANAPPVGAQLSVDFGLTGLCIRERAVQHCDDAESDPRVDAIACHNLNVRSLLVLPLLRGADLVGVFEAFSPDAHAFGSRDVETLATLAGRILENLSRMPESPAPAPVSALPFPAAALPEVPAPPLSATPPVEELSPPFHHPAIENSGVNDCATNDSVINDSVIETPRIDDLPTDEPWADDLSIEAPSSPEVHDPPVVEQPHDTAAFAIESSTTELAFPEIESLNTEALEIRAATLEPENLEAETVEPQKVEAEKIESTCVEPETVEPETVEPKTVEPEKLELEKTEAEKLEVEKTARDASPGEPSPEVTADASAPAFGFSSDPLPLEPATAPSPVFAATPRPAHPRDWTTTTLIAMVIILAVLLGWMVGRVGWLHRGDVGFLPREAPVVAPSSLAANSPPAAAAAAPAAKPVGSLAPAKPAVKVAAKKSAPPPAAPAGGLVVYQGDKVIFRQSAPPVSSANAAASSALPQPAGSQIVLPPEQAAAYVASRVEPQYPDLARNQHIQGPVVFEVWIGKNGGVQKLHVLSGNHELVDAAANAIRRWRFRPYAPKGKPVEFTTRLTVNFVLQETP